MEKLSPEGLDRYLDVCLGYEEKNGGKFEPTTLRVFCLEIYLK